MSEKNERLEVFEDQTNPMNYAKVFDKDRYIINRSKRSPRQHRKYSRFELLESHAYQVNIDKNAQRSRIAETRSQERIK